MVLLEGAAIGLILGRLYYFKGSEQRKLGHTASFVVWACLAFNTVAMFASSAIGGMPEPLLNYTRYVLPFCIVAVPYLILNDVDSRANLEMIVQYMRLTLLGAKRYRVVSDDADILTQKIRKAVFAAGVVNSFLPVALTNVNANPNYRTKV